ncbi:MAG: universal stress protein [Gammaproteobacteria bacterium]|nr:universal stress protein [Gammaproteobacteria bacterium]
MFECILAVADPTVETQNAVSRAADLARRTGARLDLLICDYDDHLAGTRFGDSADLQQGRQALLDASRERLEGLAGPLRETGIEVATHATFYHPLHEGILVKARELAPDVIVKDTHYHHALKRSIFTNTDWELIRLCPQNLLLVKNEEWSQRPVIMAAVDPMHLGDKPAALDAAILDTGEVLASAADGELHVVHCYPVSAPAAAAATGTVMPSTVDLETLRSSIESAHREALERLLQGRDIASDKIKLLAGEPRRQLVEAASEQHADVVVTGAVSRGRLKRAFLGFTALHILDRLPCDLMIIKPPAT